MQVHGGYCGAGREVGEVVNEIVRSVKACSGVLPLWLEGASAGLPSLFGEEDLKKGDMVHVWSNSAGRWSEDGKVQAVLAEATVVEGVMCPAGSVQVVFCGATGASAKWVTPKQRPHMLRKATAANPMAWITEVPKPQRAPSYVPTTPASPTAALRTSLLGGPVLGAVGAACNEAEMVVMLDELREIERGGQAFVDPTFPLVKHGRATKWVRPKEITAQAGKPCGGWAWEFLGAAPNTDFQLFRGIPRAEDVQQGVLGNCWFISSLAALADFEGGRFVRALLPGQDRVSPAGAYVVRLCLGGRWHGLLVDDLLPAMGGGETGTCTQLVNCETHRMQLWASIVEKGLAKACGSYEALNAGEAREALSILTGWPCTMISFDRPNFDSNILWATLLSAAKAGFLMACGTHNSRHASIQKWHIYTLLDVLEVNVGVKPVRLLRVRNPNGKTKWNGDWSDDSSRWTPVLRSQVGCPVGGTTGVFFIEFKDFLKYFAHCTICRIRSGDWHEERTPINVPNSKVPLVGLAFDAIETNECIFTVAQPELRIRRGPFCRDLPNSLALIGFVLLCLGPSSGGGQSVPTVVAASMPRQRSSISADCWLKAGLSYMLVPISLHGGRGDLPAAVACVSSRPVAFRNQRPHAEACQAVQAALRFTVPGSLQRGMSPRAAGCQQQ
mmetsp:Transcript_73898/g.190713  ORF Transcript_73898/g.190713 Transcript_73898/m.190713 type:complete len:670 (-) Transcript_73898:226-2235(-)